MKRVFERREFIPESKLTPWFERLAFWLLGRRVSIAFSEVIPDERFLALCKQAARSLLGQEVTVGFRELPAGYSGWAFKKPGGELVIDISPYLSLEKKFFVFLHELGHLQMHVGLPEHNSVDLHSIAVPDFVGTEEDLRSYRESPTECQADSFAEQFANYARHKAIEIYGNCRVETRLRVLASVQIINPIGGNHES